MIEYIIPGTIIILTGMLICVKNYIKSKITNTDYPGNNDVNNYPNINNYYDYDPPPYKE